MQINVFDANTCLYSTVSGMENNIKSFVQLMMILGKCHIHGSKWSEWSIPCSHGFIVEIKQNDELF